MSTKEKLILAFSLVFAMGMTACGDDSSSSGGDAEEETPASSDSGSQPPSSSSVTSQYSGFTGCAFTADADEWSFSYTRTYKKGFVQADELYVHKYTATADTIYEVESTIDKTTKGDKCDMVLVDLCGEDLDCLGVLEQTDHYVVESKLGQETYEYCSEEGLVTEVETKHVLNEFTTKVDVFGEAQEKCAEKQALTAAQ